MSFVGTDSWRPFGICTVPGVQNPFQPSLTFQMSKGRHESVPTFRRYKAWSAILFGLT